MSPVRRVGWDGITWVVYEGVYLGWLSGGIFAPRKEIAGNAPRKERAPRGLCSQPFRAGLGSAAPTALDGFPSVGFSLSTGTKSLSPRCRSAPIVAASFVPPVHPEARRASLPALFDFVLMHPASCVLSWSLDNPCGSTGNRACANATPRRDRTAWRTRGSRSFRTSRQTNGATVASFSQRAAGSNLGRRPAGRRRIN